ncbi:hypothetical protein KKB16_01375 [Patescibacteria group bacterium]|nr:hypothetical protein [Patescibacteria group bacterium]
MKSVFPPPLKIIKKIVDPVEVGKYYLKAEFSKIFSESGSVKKVVEKTIEEMSEHDYWRMLESLSFSFRLNSMFWLVGNSKYSWSLEERDIADISLTGMNPSIDNITYSKEISNNPLKFNNYLVKYFKKHPKEDPHSLEQFRNLERKVIYPTITLKESEGRIFMVDGSNRLMNLVRNGAKQVKAYIARETNPKGKMKIGDSTFYLLRVLYEKADINSRNSILNTVEILMDEASDGEKAVRTYWVEHVRDKELRQVGKKLLLFIE